MIKFAFPIHSCAHSRHVEAHLTISFIETQRDIIANNQQYNNRFNYAVSFHFGQDSNSSHLEYISLSCFRTTSSRLQSTPCLHSFPSTSSSSSNVQPTSTFYASSFFRLKFSFLESFFLQTFIDFISVLPSLEN